LAAFYATMFVTLFGFVFLAGTARFLEPRTQQALVGGSAFLLAAMGLILLVAGVRGIAARSGD
jgi:hypothetical protein